MNTIYRHNCFVFVEASRIVIAKQCAYNLHLQRIYLQRILLFALSSLYVCMVKKYIIYTL